MAEELEQQTPKFDDVTCGDEKIGDLTDHPVQEAISEFQFDDKRSFSEELNQHKTSIVWAFDYGEEVAKKTEKNIHAYQKKFLERHGIVTDGSPSSETPSCSVTSADMSEPSTSKAFTDQQTPHSEKHTTTHTSMRKRARCSETGDAWTPQRTRATPLPMFTWANSTEVWQTMVYREEATSRTRNCRLFEDPCSFLPRMRAILVDWIMEVCEVYRLRRVTYYLAIDYIDRFLTVKPSVPKHQLQLIGISALFIAAKLEEIYPPKLSEFSYVCDGACTNDDILECELLLLNTLGWDVNPMTCTGWLNLYMQLHCNFLNKNKTTEEKSKNFFYPQYSQLQFVRASHLMDLFSLDPGFLLFSYSVIAACAMYFLFGRKAAIRVSGLSWTDLQDCVEYMAVFYTVIRDAQDPRLHSILSHEADELQLATYSALKISLPGVTPNDYHSMQLHVVDLKYFEKATLLKLQRMGFHVRKTYVQKKKVYGTGSCGKESAEIINEEEYTEADDNLSAGSPIIMFEIERISDSECEMLTGGVVSTVSEADTEFFDAKSKYTFDEILVGINDCTSKMLLPRRMCKNGKKN